MKQIIVLALAALLLSACSTTPIAIDMAKEIPSERLYEASFVASDNINGKALVDFTRDSGFIGSGCSHTMYIDNVKAFAMHQGEGITVQLDPGDHFFRIELGAGICPNEAYSQNVSLKTGEHQAYRILTSSNFNLSFTRIR